VTILEEKIVSDKVAEIDLDALVSDQELDAALVSGEEAEKLAERRT
jgi:hypothetical protein